MATQRIVSSYTVSDGNGGERTVAGPGQGVKASWTDNVDGAMVTRFSMGGTIPNPEPSPAAATKPNIAETTNSNINNSGMLTFVYPDYLNKNPFQYDDTSNLNFMMFFGMHLNNEKNGNVVICLPIPAGGLSDSLKAGWKSEENMAETTLRVANTVTSEQNVGTAVANVGNATGNILGSAIQPVADLKAGKDEMFGNAKGDNDIPIFERMDNREHTFSWDFTPTTLVEANLIISICNTFKIGTLPHFKPGQPMLGFPPRWNIKTRFRKYGMDFKTSVIKSCSIKYGGGESYNEFQVDKESNNQGIATKISLELTFGEISKPNTLLLTDPDRQRTDRDESPNKKQNDKWAEAKKYSNNDAGTFSRSINDAIRTGFLNADTFSGNAEMLD